MLTMQRWNLCINSMHFNLRHSVHTVCGGQPLLPSRLDSPRCVRHLRLGQVPYDSMLLHIPSRLPRYVDPPL